jgi:hypothetical protein
MTRANGVGCEFFSRSLFRHEGLEKISPELARTDPWIPAERRVEMWRPTGGRFQILETALNRGDVNQKNIYLHFSNEDGIRNIVKNMSINDKRRNETRAGSAKGIYLASSTHTLNAENVWILLFLGNEMYKDRGSWVVIFGFTPTAELKSQPVTEGSWARELIYMGADVTFSQADLLYSGPNPFINIFTQAEHPILENLGLLY